jgi:antitoxin (DNA-binding transcriptional repressor) of toxin-antitoxin stability system
VEPFELLCNYKKREDLRELVGPPHKRYNTLMNTIPIQDVQRDPFGCIRRVEEGETLVILRDERPVAEIKPVLSLERRPRPFGLAAGQFTVPEDFDLPLPEDILLEFEGR